jgi:hypothetical protein
MKTKLIIAMFGALGLAGAASAATVVGSFDAASTSTVAFIDFSGTGTFSYELAVTPTTTNKLKLTFAKPIAGSFSNLSYSIFDGATLMQSASINTAATAYTFNDNAAAFANVQLDAGHKYSLFLNGDATTNSSNFAQFKITASTGTIAAVPEPETYAMLLAGLGLMGAIAKRRKAKQS